MPKKEELSLEVVQSTLQELIAAALSFAAVSHPTYTVPRKRARVKQVEARLRKAAKAYHSVVVGRSVP